MADFQQNLVRLQDLNIIAEETHSNAMDAISEKEQQQVIQEFAQTDKEINAFLAKIFPQAIDVLCSLNKLITRRGKILFFNNQAVQSSTFTHENCLTVCKEAISAFPHTVNTMVAALKSRAGAAYIEEISVKLCREFNTISVIHSNINQLQSERVSHIIIKPTVTETVDDTDNFSEEITILIGKAGVKDISIEFNINSAGANSVVVSGITRSGKSAFLQSLILGAAYKYSPDQLQFWVLDFKDGTGFVHLEGLKHIRFMCLKNRPIDAIEITNYIDKEYKRRADLIRESGGGDMKDYNKRAKEKRLPLLPRLFIVIDEFTFMYRSCFATLSKIARLGVSTGIGFIFSSQIIESGAAYGDAIMQANHLFEFQNADNLFGRLIKNVTQAEKTFVGSGVKGNCVYRYGEKLRVMFRAAYAGELSEQKEFLKVINEKWQDYHYDKPLIAGSPERNLNNADLLITNWQEIKDRFKQTKKIFVPIGGSRMGEPYLYRIDRDNPILISFGDEARVASVELSVIEHFKHLSDSEQSVYYIDLNCNPDREINSVTAKYGEVSSDVCYVATDSGAKRIIDKVYKILIKRRQLSTTDRTKDIGNPIELFIHNAERISELKEIKHVSKIGALTREQPIIPANNDLDEILPSPPKADMHREEEDDIDTLEKLSEIIEKGKNSRIYVMLYFEERSRFQALENSLFNYSFEFKDVLVIPRIPDPYEELSYSEVVDSFMVCRLREQASALDQANGQADGQAKLEQGDFIYAVLVDDKVPHKIVPYEWVVEEK